MTNAVIFDLGNVVNFWEPHLAIASLFPDETQAKEALQKSGFMEWNGRVVDGGEDIEAELALLGGRVDLQSIARTYIDNLELAHQSEVPGTLEIVKELRSYGVPMFGMTNTGVECFDIMRKRFEAPSYFNDTFVSAVERLMKPDDEAYALLLGRNNLESGDCIFIDDSVKNIDAAKEIGIDAIQFFDASQLRQDLEKRGLLAEKQAVLS